MSFKDLIFPFATGASIASAGITGGVAANSIELVTITVSSTALLGLGFLTSAAISDMPAKPASLALGLLSGLAGSMFVADRIAPPNPMSFKTATSLPTVTSNPARPSVTIDGKQYDCNIVDGTPKIVVCPLTSPSPH